MNRRCCRVLARLYFAAEDREDGPVMFTLLTSHTSSLSSLTPVSLFFFSLSPSFTRSEEEGEHDPLRTSAACRLFAAMILRVHVYIQRLLPPVSLSTRLAAAAAATAASRSARDGRAQRERAPEVSPRMG